MSGQIRFHQDVEEQAWFYLRISDDSLPAFDAGASGDVRRYGVVLESGRGEYPPEDMLRFMKEEYGFSTPR